MRKYKFNKIKEKNPESRIGKRSREYQKTRDGLAKAIKGGNVEKEKSARINYLVEKIFSEEKLKKTDYDFILGLSKQELNNFVSLTKIKVNKYKNSIISDSEYRECSPSEYDVEAFINGNKILRFIGQLRSDVDSKMIRINRSRTYVNPDTEVNSRSKEMQSMYANRDEMVRKNEADMKERREELKQSRMNTIKDKDRQEIFDKIYGDKEAVLKDLKENFVTIEENIEMFGCKGKKVKFELPAVGDFKGFTFESFISEGRVNAKDLKKTSRLEKQLYSMKEIGNLLGAIKKYMEQCNINVDGQREVNYEKELKHVYDSDAGAYLNSILELNSEYRLKDTILLGQESDYTIEFRPHAVYYGNKDRSHFENSKNPLGYDDVGDIIANRLFGGKSGSKGINEAKLLIKLS